MTTTEVHEPDEFYALCPACGSPSDYCQGHGPIGDPVGHAILLAHDYGIHDGCHPDADCPREPQPRSSRVRAMAARRAHASAERDWVLS